jgi:hypothetical protein
MRSSALFNSNAFVLSGEKAPSGNAEEYRTERLYLPDAFSCFCLQSLVVRSEAGAAFLARNLHADHPSHTAR